MSELHSNGSKGEQNRLVGWLVSYALDARGAAFELRTGRLFLSTAQLGDNRTVTLADDSISAPHVAVSVSKKNQIQIQDIFSEHGTYITKFGSDKEQRISGPTNLDHGDWLRIGKSTKFQLCIVDMGK